MKFQNYNKIGLLLLGIVLILEGVSIILNANDIWEILRIIFAMIIILNIGVIIGYKVLE